MKPCECRPSSGNIQTFAKLMCNVVKISVKRMEPARMNSNTSGYLFEYSDFLKWNEKYFFY
jgi:hypothetical protein